MGCLQSKRVQGSHTENTSRMVFQVINVDESGRDLSSGQLQITDSDIILYRQGREMTLWPLHSLRKYGYDGTIFSFESGRRCETGEGIYAFRCRKASLLFHVLQEQIHQRNLLHEEMRRAARAASPVLPYRPAQDNNLSVEAAPNNVPTSISAAALAAILPPTLPSNPAVHEATPLYPPSNVSQDTVPMTEIGNKREHNNNQSGTNTVPHRYCNDLNRDLAILRNALHQETEIKTWLEIQDETRFLKTKMEREAKKELAEKEAAEKEAKKLHTVQEAAPLSPTLSITSSNSRLSSEQQLDQVQESRMYMNLNTGTSKHWALAEMNRNSYGPTTPTTPTSKSAEYCNVNVKAEMNTYANLALREVSDSVSSLKQNMLHFDAPISNPKVSESDTATSMSPLEDMEVNYAVLDIDSNKDNSNRSLKDLVSPDRTSVCSSKNESTASGSSAARVRLLSQQSLDSTAPSVGYTTIDFDKTVALTSVAAGSSGIDLDADGARKTRHNSTNVVCSSPTSADKNKVFL